jgi:hypothetical protein
MVNGQLNWMASFLWNIADDVLGGHYVRGKTKSHSHDTSTIYSACEHLKKSALISGETEGLLEEILIS